MRTLKWIATVCSAVVVAAALGSAPDAAYATAGPGPSSNGGGVISAVSRGPNLLDVFYRGAYGAYYHKFGNGSQWQTEYVGGADSLTGKPTAIARGPYRVDLFIPDMWGRIYHKWWDGFQWFPSQTGFHFLGGSLSDPPSVVSMNTNQLNVFARGTDGTLYYKELNGSSWWPSETGWHPMGGGVVGAPSATSWGPGRMDVFVRRTDNRLYTRSWRGYWDPSPTEFKDLGGDLGEPPVAVSWGPNRIDVFAKDRVNGNLYHKWLVGEEWGPGRFGFEWQGGIFVGMPTVVCKASDRIDILPTGTDGDIYVKSWTGYAWVPSLSAYTDIGGPVFMSGPPAAVSWGPDRVDVFSWGSDGRIYDAVWQGWWRGPQPI